MNPVRSTKFTVLGVSLLALTLAACATPPPPEAKEPPLTGTITLSSGPCAGLCPIYTMRVSADDTYQLDARDNTISPGKSGGSLPVNSYRRALEALEAFDIASMQRYYTPTEPDNCTDFISELPTVDFAHVDDENDVREFVTFNSGCVGFADRDRLDRLHQRLREVFRVQELVAVGEPPRPDNTGGASLAAPTDG